MLRRTPLYRSLETFFKSVLFIFSLAPSFLEQLNNRDEGEATLRSELSELQTHHVEAVNELEKTRTLLRVQVRFHPSVALLGCCIITCG